MKKNQILLISSTLFLSSSFVLAAQDDFKILNEITQYAIVPSNTTTSFHLIIRKNVSSTTLTSIDHGRVLTKDDIDHLSNTMLKSYNVYIEKNKHFETHTEKTHVDFSCFDCIVRCLDVETLRDRPGNLGFFE